ncbi:MAG: M4 family metallopeptidase [Candidatus Gracilibacteria bacterium]|nr:M4 family metallopeptidase [Candidatus Gracilibacteria bacterium]
MSQKKYQAALLVITINISALFPSALFANTQTPINTTQHRYVSQETKQRLIQQKQHLQGLGNPEEYKALEIQWDNTDQKPREIRNIHKKATRNIERDTKSIVSDLAALYGVDPVGVPDLRLDKEDVSKLSRERHTRLKQFYGNLEIVGGDIISHTDKNGILYQIDGRIQNVSGISITPKITAKNALDLGKKEHGSKLHFQVIKNPELILYAVTENQVLAYRYTIGYDDPIGGKNQWIYYVDAVSGKKINAYDTIHHASIPATVSGSLLDGEGGGIKTLTGTFDIASNKYSLRNLSSPDSAYAIYNTSSDTGAYTDALSVANRTTSNWGTTDQSEFSAAYNISKTLEYYKMFGFGVNNITFYASGQTFLPIYVHEGSNYANAYWSPEDGLYIGDGDGVQLRSLATLDIMAHEFGHAWTDNTSHLIYQNEQGALNESFSDISGVNVELYVQQNAENSYPNDISGESDWLVGEDATIDTRALRDMRNPANSATVGVGNEQPTRYKGTYWYTGNGDNGGVHYNSSVQNLFYYLLAKGGSGNNDGILYSIDGIGIEEARRIAFETNTHFVTDTTDYKGVRQAWIDAANSLHPTDISFANSVKAAWDAVGVSGNPITSFSDVSESFENSTQLPVGWNVSAVGGSEAIGEPWFITTSTGAIGNNSLVSGVLQDNSNASVSWSGVTDAGYASFYWRTSSEAGYDTLEFYVDGERKNSWSGLNPWSFYSEPISAGEHTLTWKYSKDFSVSDGLDQVGIDAVQMVYLTGSLGYSSSKENGFYVSGENLRGFFSAPDAYNYTVSRSDGQMAKGSSSGTTSFPLYGMPEGFGSIDFQYRTTNGFLSQIFTKDFYVDSIAPSTPELSLPLNGGIYNTHVMTFYWSAVTDSGAGLAPIPYTYFLATDDNFINIVQSGSTDTTSTTLSISDGTYYTKIQAKDLVGNTSTSSVHSFRVDTTPPNSLTHIMVNGGNVIDIATQTGVSISGSGDVSESGGIVSYEIYDSTKNVNGTGVLDSFGSFHISGIDVSGLSDGLLNYSVTFADRAGNVADSTHGTIGKSVVPADGSITFLSGAYTNTKTTSVQIYAGKAVTYTISGDGIASSITGSLDSNGTVNIPLELISYDGIKMIQIMFVDSVGISTVALASIILDTTPPVITIDSHREPVNVTDASILMTGSISDTNGIASATFDSLPLLSPAHWSQMVHLDGGVNSITLTAIDNAGNGVISSLHINRDPSISGIVTSPIPSGMLIHFDTNIDSHGTVFYGTASGSLTQTENIPQGLSHDVTITSLNPDTVYYYGFCPVAGADEGNLGCLFIDVQSISVFSFRTPKIVDITTDTPPHVSATGAVVFSGVSATGTTSFHGTGTLIIRDQDITSNAIVVDFSGLTITTRETGTWNGVMEAPKVATFTGARISENGYVLTGSVYKAGNSLVGLGFSGQLAQVQIYVGTPLNGTVLHVYRSDSNPLFDLIDTCTVLNGLCQFETDHFSYFAVGNPVDSIPDTFSFSPQTGVELGANIDSSIVTITGTNTPSNISIIGGMYSVNNLAYTSATGVVSSGDVIKVRVVSSPAYSTSLQATTIIGGVSAIFSVTTKGAPVTVSGGGGGGGGGMLISMDNCRQGDASGSYYDGKCDISPQVSSQQTKNTPSERGFLSANPIIGGYDFTKNERIPQKVAAELNFFITKLVKAIDHKATANLTKKQAYYNAVAQYMLSRAKKTNNKREKRIFSYLYARFVIVTKIKIQ